MNKKETHLVIWEWITFETTIQTELETKKREIYHLLIWRKRLHRFYNRDLKVRFNNLNNTGKLLISYLTKQYKEPITLNIPEDILNNLKRYLLSREEIEKNNLKLWWWTNNYFDCSDFVYFLKWWWKWSEMLPISDKDWYKEWEVICIYNKDFNNWHHLAIYIWEWLFLSKYWWLSISITNLEQMLDFYNANASVKTIKKD